MVKMSRSDGKARRVVISWLYSDRIPISAVRIVASTTTARLARRRVNPYWAERPGIVTELGRGICMT